MIDAVGQASSEPTHAAPHPGEPRRDLGAVACVSAMYVVVTGWLAWRLPLWRDEIDTLRISAAGVFGAAERAIHWSLQAPGYFVFQALWRRLFPEPLAARIPSVLFGALTVFVGAALFRRLVPGVRARWGALLLGASPLVVWAGTEARLYALALLIGAAYAWLLLRVHVDGWRLGRLLIVLLGAVALYTQYYLGFVLLAGGVFVLCLRRPRELAWYAAEMLAVAALFAPHVSAVLQEVSTRAHDGVPQALSLRDLVLGVETEFTQLTLGSPAMWLEGIAARALRWGYRIALAVAVAAAFWRSRRTPGLAIALTLVLALTLVPLAVGRVATSFVGLAWYLRYWTGFAVLGMLAPVVLVRVAGVRAALAAAILVASGNAVLTFCEHRTMGKWGDSRAVAQRLQADERPNEPILIIPADAVLSLEYYYRGVNRLEPVPHPLTGTSWSIADMIPSGPEDLQTVLHRAGDPAAFWLYNDMPEVEDEIEPWLAQGWRLERHLRFPGGRAGGATEMVAHLRRFVRATP